MVTTDVVTPSRMILEILPLKLILFTLLLWPISRVWLRFQDGGVKLGEFLFWTGIWLGAVFMIFYPSFLSYVAELLGIGRGVDLVIYGSIAILFYLVFRANVGIENLRHEISRLVRMIALMEIDKKGKKKGK